MKQIIPNYTFNAAAKTLTLTDFTTVRADRLLLVWDITQSKEVYSFGDTTTTVTAATNVFTFAAVPVGAANADKLMVIYETLSADPKYDTETVTISGVPAVTGSGTFSTTDVDHVNSLLTPFASAARTATPTAVQVANLYGNAALLYFNATVTPNNTETITITILGVDPVSTNTVLAKTLTPILSSALGATPAAGAGTVVFRLDWLPRTFAILPTHSGATSWTYSIGLHPMAGDGGLIPTLPGSAATNATNAALTASTDATVLQANASRREAHISNLAASGGATMWMNYGAAAAANTADPILPQQTAVVDFTSAAIHLWSTGTPTYSVVEIIR